MKTAGSFAATLAGCLMLTGCIGIAPLPERSERYGRRLQRDDVKFIQAGSTTRAEVVARLGTNYASLPHEQAVAYTWETGGVTFTLWLFAAVPDAACSEQLGGTHRLWGGWQGFFIAFDADDCVSRTSFKSLDARALHAQLDEWHRRGLPPPGPCKPSGTPGKTP